MRRLTLFLTAALLASTTLASMPTSVLAECPFFVIPPATAAAPSAREIIVGTVVENVGGSYEDFRLRIDHVLRGPAKVGDVRRFDNVYPGWPVAGVTDTGEPFTPCAPIPGFRGNVIALSLGALAPDGTTRYNAASWLSGKLPYNRDLPRTTLAEMRSLISAPRTDTAEPSHQAPVPPTGIVLPVTAGLLAAVYVLLRNRRIPAV